MEGFDPFCTGSIPVFLRFVGNERTGAPLCSLYHSDPLKIQAHFLGGLLGRVGALRRRLVCSRVIGIGRE